jgi:hypothetical protein
MKSLNIDAVISWEIGLIVIFFGLIILLLGSYQSKQEIDIDKLPLIKPTTKIVLGFFLILFGSIQLLPLLKGL